MSDDLVAALRAYRQADADGVMVLVSREACEKAADRIEALEAERAAEMERRYDRLTRDLEIVVAERDRARAQLDNAIKLLTGIHGLLYPAPLKLEDDRTMVFRPGNPHEYLQALSDRIRALPDQLQALVTPESPPTAAPPDPRP